MRVDTHSYLMDFKVTRKLCFKTKMLQGKQFFFFSFLYLKVLRLSSLNPQKPCFIQSDLLCIQDINFFPGNQPHDFGVTNSILDCYSSYRIFSVKFCLVMLLVLKSDISALKNDKMSVIQKYFVKSLSTTHSNDL